MSKVRAMILGVASLMAAPALAQDNARVDYAESRILFEVSSGDTLVQGSFTDWTAEVVLPPDDLDRAAISVMVDVTSAQTGNAVFDTVLHGVDWLDTARYPMAQFVSDTIFDREDGAHGVRGHLTLKDMTHPIILTIHAYAPSPNSALPFADIYHVEGILLRTTYDLGSGFDAIIVGPEVQISAQIRLIP